LLLAGLLPESTYRCQATPVCGEQTGEGRSFSFDTGQRVGLVSDFNARAQQFYLGRGYSEVGRIPGYVLDDVAECIFYKAGRS
jgi:hypothetical protein